MLLHQTSGRWRLGLVLSIVTVMLWGVLPTALSILLKNIDVVTVTWFRFVSSGLVLMVYLASKRPELLNADALWAKLKSLRLTGQEWLLLMSATLCMGLDYILFLNGIVGTSPANAEVLTQIAPALMGLGAIVLFKERFNSKQWTGLGVLALGFVLFFHDKLQVITTSSIEYWRGNIFVILASIVWATYALTQKQLLQKFSSSTATLIIYVFCTLALTPFAQPQLVFALDALNLGLLIFCSLVALVSFAAFAESLNHLEASKISAIGSLSPIFTFLSVWLFSWLTPSLIAPEPITGMGILGATVVVAGSAMVAMGE